MTTDHRGDEHLRRLAVVLTDAIDTADCQRCLDQIEFYIDHQLAGRDYRRLLPASAQHLDQCVRCAEDYAMVYELRRNEAALPQPTTIPAARLDFLRRPTQAQGAERLDQHSALRAALSTDGARLTVTLSPALLAALPAPTQAMALRSSAAPPLLTIAFEQPTAQIATLQLSAHRHPPASDLFLLRVQVELYDRAWPELAGIAVHLILGQEQRDAATDAWGEAVFSAIPQSCLADLSVTVEA
ncbi:MAG: hypothetical protein H0T53_01930 [Herpetosiphonaceae bacterium]|nr:hypothetical protein [Herpetosiphonaceae bacterium]